MRALPMRRYPNDDGGGQSRCGFGFYITHFAASAEANKESAAHGGKERESRGRERAKGQKERGEVATENLGFLQNLLDKQELFPSRHRSKQGVWLKSVGGTESGLCTVK